MNIVLYNTMSRKKEEIASRSISYYTCGPTIYNFAHIGNFRTYVFEDLLKRALLFLGYSVNHVMNITDVDDKTIKGAISQKMFLKEYTEPFKKGFFEDSKILRILPANDYPEATQYIDEMIAIIQVLLDKKIAYKGSDGSIYFSIAQFPSYGKLSHLKIQELSQGASQRMALDEYDKEHASDFVLWKSYDPKRDGTIFWNSPFGPGRPGWHIECSAMALKLLGDTVDIHCGGVDNIFPHHENEIAQSESYTGKTFVRHWVHVQHLIVEGKKMSKSLGNFYTLRDLLQKGYSGREIRYLLLSVHYRMSLNFTFEGLKAARAALQRIDDFLQRMAEIDTSVSEGKVSAILQKMDQDMKEALADDLNISAALAVLFEGIRQINVLYDAQSINLQEAERIIEFFHKIDNVLAILPEKKETVPEEILDALSKRDKAREEKNFLLADELRDFIASKGYVIEDTPKGSRIKKN
ncbi:MAG: cysteine--tRNA ligase [Parachlamydiales bacterium]|nr:cysteine--tRNA ligase [Parachlamydiales bacterium]